MQFILVQSSAASRLIYLMAGEVAAAEVIGVKHLSSAEAAAEEEKLRLLREAVHALPVSAVKDLWSIGVRLFFIDIL